MTAMLASAPLIFLLAQAGSASTACDASASASLVQDARLALADRQFDAAAAKFQNAFDVCPRNLAILADKAKALLLAGRFTDALHVSDRILWDEPANAAALKVKGNAEYFLGRFDAATGTFVTLLEQHPDDEDAAYMLGRIYYQEDRVDLAIGQFERVLKLNPQSYKAWDNLGLCWQARGETDKAIRHFLQAIKLVETDHPDYDWAYANLADLLIQTGDFQHAFDAAAKAANRNPNSARNFYIGAKALDRLGKTDLALNWLQRAAGLDPTYSEAQYLLSRVYQKLGRREDAEAARKRFTELKEKEPAKRR